MNVKTVNLALVAALMLGACAGRAPAPVSIAQPQDNTTACAGLQSEIAANNRKIAELGTEKGWKVAQNVTAGVAGLIIWPLWFAMDFQGAAGTEQAALEDRNAYLASRAEEACQQQDVAAPAPPVERAEPAVLSVPPPPPATFAQPVTEPVSLRSNADAAAYHGSGGEPAAGLDNPSLPLCRNSAAWPCRD